MKLIHPRLGLATVVEIKDFAVTLEINGENRTFDKRFARLQNEDGTDFYVKEEPKKKQYKSRNRSTKPVSQLDRNKNLIMSINNNSYKFSNDESVIIWVEMIYSLLNKGSDFIKSICNTLLKTRTVSDKQAYVVAKFAVENNIKL